MRKLILGVSATALIASAAAFAQDEDNTRLAAAEGAPTFTKLDADQDGRISAIEAANNSKVAAGFTSSDEDKDGYDLLHFSSPIEVPSARNGLWRLGTSIAHATWSRRVWSGSGSGGRTLGRQCLVQVARPQSF